MKAKFTKAVENGDIENVRLFLSNELLLDPRGESFHEMLNYATSRLNGLFVADDDNRSEKNPSEWDENFMSKVKNELDMNFSREKLSYYEKVAKQVLKDKAHELDAEDARNRNANMGNANHTQQQTTEEPFDHKKVYTGVTVGGGILTIVGLCASSTVLTILGACAAVGGGYMLYKEERK